MDFTQVSYTLQHGGKVKHDGFIVESGDKLTEAELEKKLVSAKAPLNEKGVTIEFEKIVTTNKDPSGKNIFRIHNIENPQEINSLSEEIQKQAEKLIQS